LKTLALTTPLLILIVSFSACKEDKTTPLPILGFTDIVDGDTIYHKIPEFDFITQDSVPVSNESLSESLYIADFFFMSCPSICPKVKQQMLRIYKRYENDDIIKLVSHTLDPKRDTPERLKMYASNLGVKTDKWMFLTGNKNEIYDIAGDYFVSAYEDEDAPGGLDHSGKILLVDTKGHIRAFAEGTDPDDVTEFFSDIDKLLAEYAAQ